MPSRTRIELFLSIEEFKKGAIKSPKKTNNKIITKIELTSTFRKKSILFRIFVNILNILLLS